MVWYYGKDGKQIGPLDDDEIRAAIAEGEIEPADLVWNEEMGSSWRRADAVPGLMPPPPSAEPAASATPPPLPVQSLGSVSCTSPVSVAWRRMVEMLFRPFSMAKWFGLGVTAWLAALGEGGGGGFNLGGGQWAGGGRKDLKLPDGGDITQAVEAVRQFLARNGSVIALAAAVGAVVALGVGLALLWVRCRGKFVFLDNVLNDRREVGEPWHAFAQHGNSLFRWNVVYGIVCLLALLPAGCLAIVGAVLPVFRTGKLAAASLPSLWGAGALTVVLGAVMGYIGRFREDFVVPIMYRNDLTATEAWGRFLPLLRQRFGSFVLYGLFYAVLQAVAGACVLTLVVITCCIAGCLLGIPVVGTVVVLPIPVFFRLYSVGYLAQFGGAFDATVESPAAQP